MSIALIALIAAQSSSLSSVRPIHSGVAQCWYTVGLFSRVVVTRLLWDCSGLCPQMALTRSKGNHSRVDLLSQKCCIRRYQRCCWRGAFDGRGPIEEREDGW